VYQELNIYAAVASHMKEYRQGGIGAMMDEYERAAHELIHILSTIEATRYEAIIDETASEDTRSIQAIMRHVAGSGYGYANYLRTVWNIPVASPDRTYESRDGAIAAVRKMLAYTSETLEGRWLLSEEEADKTTFIVSWGVLYSVEQILEHAIVHILRHRRQIEKILGQ
jgi:uncharacterized damage-inducible protein DinB